MALDNPTATQAKLIDEHYPGMFQAALAEKTRLAIDAVNANAVAVKTVTFVVEVPIEAGAVRSGYFKPGFAGTVLRVEIICSDRPTSAADGCTAALRNNSDAIVDSFDLTAIPEFTAAAEDLTLTANVAFTADDIFRSLVIAGADVVAGKNVTFIVTVERA